MPDVPSQKITTFLMLDGKADDAMTFYTSLFDDAEILSISRYGANETGTEGTVQHATFALAGQQFMCIDSNVTHDFGFTPAISLYVQCEAEAEIGALYTELAQDGATLMQLGLYDFSQKFGWVNDRFGVSWQLNLG